MTLYYEGKRFKVAAMRPLGMGAEGIVYGTDSNPRFCFKVYRSASAERDARTAALLRMPPVDWPGTDGHHAAWPLRSLTDEWGRVRVVAMRRAGGVSLHALFDPDQRPAALDSPTWATLLRVALNLTRLFADLHRIGVVIGDISPSNLLVDRRGQVVLIDCDSVQFTDPATGREFLTSHLTPEYAAPESVPKRDSGNVGRLARAHDLFGLAVIIGQLLLEGDHPFEGVSIDGDDQGIEANIRAGNCRLLFPERFASVPGQLTVELLPAPVTALLWQAFADGYADPARRPSTEQWETALIQALNDLIGCRHASDVHFYRQGLASCVWCDRLRMGMRDHYPSAAAPRPTVSSRTAAPPPPVEEDPPAGERHRGRRPDPPPANRGRS